MYCELFRLPIPYIGPRKAILAILEGKTKRIQQDCAA